MYNTPTSIFLIVGIIGLILTSIKLISFGCAFLYKKAEETSLSQARVIESERGEFALLIKSLQHQIELMSTRIDELEHKREELEADNKECMEEVKKLKNQLKD